MRYIGDIHGKLRDYENILLDCEQSVQVGDFGIGFSSPYWHNEVNKIHKDGNHRFIRGNHDNPTLCREEMRGYIMDGTIEDDTMYIGGAWSIDYQWRTSGVDWWPEEELSQRELDILIEKYVNNKPGVMITHDCPTSISYDMFIKSGQSLGGSFQTKTRTAEAFQTMFEEHQPELWIFGHWHVTKKYSCKGTEFICLSELEYIDV